VALPPVGKYKHAGAQPKCGSECNTFYSAFTSRINGMLKEDFLEYRLYQSPVLSSGLPDFRVE